MTVENKNENSNGEEKCPFSSSDPKSFDLKMLENNHINEDKIMGCPFLNSKRPVPTRYGQGCQDDVCHTATMDKATGPWT
eukprot:Pgem_evm1s16036